MRPRLRWGWLGAFVAWGGQDRALRPENRLVDESANNHASHLRWLTTLRARLHGSRRYVDLRWAVREGVVHAWRRRRLQHKILTTPPVRTATAGPVEVRVLTWRRDCIDALWALKSFYHFAQVDYPLFIHDGGLLPGQVRLLARHFPAARIITATDADRLVDAELERRGLQRCLSCRSKHPMMRKLFDFFLLSKADYLISIDSDILFFRCPELLCIPPGGIAANRYNEDDSCWYAMSLEEMELTFGIKVAQRINAGLSVIRRQSVDFTLVERWLACPKLSQEIWLTEQTLHALCAAVNGVELLPRTYLVSTAPGLPPGTVCKHYAGFFRPLHYEEGMRYLIGWGFLDALRRQGGPGAA